MSPATPRTRRLAVVGLATASLITTLVAAPAAADPPDPAIDTGDPAAVAAASVTPSPPPEPATITNPVSSPFADSYADPAVLRGRDGWFYAYATSDPLVSGGEFGLMHMARTRDFADWEYLGTVFDDATRPAWAAPGSFFWAPDVRYVNGEYRLYYTVTDSLAKPGADPGIGMATAPTPAGPWTDIGRPVLESQVLAEAGATAFDLRDYDGAVNSPRELRSPELAATESARAAVPAYQGLIDPSVLADTDGSLYLYVGGFAGGPHVTRLDDTGTTAIGELQQIAVSDRYEGSYVVQHDGAYYLMVSAAGCCSSVASGYSVFAGRSDSPFGPFVDAAGVPLNQSRAGGTQVIAANGNRWVGVGHHAVVTDTTGQDWMVYHGIDRNDGWLNEPGGINKRPMLVDRLDWIDGWPVVNAGAGPSDGPEPGPVTGSALGITTDDPASGRAFRALTGSFASVPDDDGDAGQVAALRPGRRVPAVAVARELLRGENRVEADVRLAGADAEACVRVDGLRRGVEVCVDGAARELVVDARPGGRDVTAAVPERIDLEGWHTLVVTLEGDAVAAELQESRLGDPIARAVADVRRGGGVEGLLSLTARGAGADLDNLSVARLAEGPTTRVPDPEVGDVTYTQTFDGSLDDVLADGWTLLGEHPGLTTADGALSWPLTSGDIAGANGAGPVLVRDAPAGDWVLETDLELDLGTDTVRNFQQAGLLVMADENFFVRLSSVAIGHSRTVEFFTEREHQGVLLLGGHLDGPPATEITLRILRTENAAGEQLYRSAFSIDDGVTWRWGMTWTLPAGTDVRIGLQAGGGATPATTAAFEEVRIRDAA
ncbi:glycoside hydrolase family 43 [Beutenbergia cavernae DSM 12333]|uniref:Glycoside hydrolase family 43 n=1 Tax=Beutenbergia cavernae (strain ATCC BAA-8 / DSM 12333 / CCUG 43141 / JCM 11478 / NBRC 16432 / NCIMB 13614 / HKI 0122) TaxID=471853 RepID=C5BX61_BEUC1|nr:family 43 glycosylhydrolase [Beutenbergia cavernae]ACQ78736.1 glycoside hydrolase family 43 [Beutenbergia cavernae DSM 12333]